ncbi:MAG: DUF305 domain-containing protein [Rhodoluna sp.]|nr:DUF305 domain-containing protein [Rhodoluna sp.]
MKRLLVSVALVLALPVLSGCSAEHSGHDSVASQSSYNSGELMFAQMMIPHHKQAVAMSALAPTHTDNDDLLGLAANIKAAQQPEIEQMTGWITASGSQVDTHHSMAMDGMLTETEMASLEAATGAEFDRLYLSGMIKHHQGAIDMLSMISSSTNPEVVTLRENIRKTQTAEIKQMQDLLKKY